MPVLNVSRGSLFRIILIRCLATRRAVYYASNGVTCQRASFPSYFSWPERESHALARSRIHLLQEMFYAGAVTVAAAASPAAVAVVPSVFRTLFFVVGDAVPPPCL